MRLALLFEIRPLNASAVSPPDLFAEFESAETIQATVLALEQLGHTVKLIDSQNSPFETLLRERPNLDLVVNVSVGRGSRTRELLPAAMCEALGIPYTGSDAMAQAVAANKHLAKLVAQREGVPTPAWTIAESVEAATAATIAAEDVILKPLYEGSSIGVAGPIETSGNRNLLAKTAARLFEDYKQPIIIEQFISGYEITVPVLGNPSRPLTPVGLSLYDSVQLGDRIFDSLAKQDPKAASWETKLPFPSRLFDDLRLWGKQLHDALGCFDLSRSDFRVTADGEPFFVEINATPQLSPFGSSFSSSALAEGMNFADLMGQVIDAAQDRLRLKVS